MVYQYDKLGFQGRTVDKGWKPPTTLVQILYVGIIKCTHVMILQWWKENEHKGTSESRSVVAYVSFTWTRIRLSYCDRRPLLLLFNAYTKQTNNNNKKQYKRLCGNNRRDNADENAWVGWVWIFFQIRCSISDPNACPGDEFRHNGRYIVYHPATISYRQHRFRPFEITHRKRYENP